MPSKSYSKILLALGGLLLMFAALSASYRQSFRPTEKAFFADERTVNYVRPGLDMKVTKAEIAADGTIRAWVKVVERMSQSCGSFRFIRFLGLVNSR